MVFVTLAMLPVAAVGEEILGLWVVAGVRPWWLVHFAILGLSVGSRKHFVGRDLCCL